MDNYTLLFSLDPNIESRTYGVDLIINESISSWQTEALAVLGVVLAVITEFCYIYTVVRVTLAESNCKSLFIRDYEAVIIIWDRPSMCNIFVCITAFSLKLILHYYTYICLEEGYSP